MKKFIRPFSNFTLVFFFLMLIAFNSFAQVAPVNPPTGGFNIDGTLKANTAAGDWIAGTGAGGFVLQQTAGVWGPINSTTTKFVRDSFDNTADRIFTGSSFGDDPNTWKWTTGKATAKCDINNALFHSTTSATQKWLILGGDRFAQTGTSYIDFQFSQGIFTRTATGFSSVSATGGSLAATNGRTVGDFVLSMEYTAGGAVATVHYYRWELSGTAYKFVEKPIPAPGGVASAFGASNTAATDVPYGAFGSTSYAPFAFVEAAVNIGAILTGSCQTVNIKTIFVSTKASDSYSAALKDFVDPQPVDFVFGNAGLSYGATSFCKEGTQAPTVPDPVAGTFAGSAGLSINSTTGVIDFTATDAGTYTATYTPTGGVCLTPATAVITVVAKPIALVLSGSTICTSVTGTGSITSTTSVTGVSYQLYNSSDAPIQSSKAGNGSGITWSNVPAGTGYYAIATGAAPTSCTSPHSNNVSVVEVTNPAALVLSGSSICSSAPNTGTISSSTSGPNTVSYQLYNSSNAPIQTAKLGTGSGLTWTALAAGNGYYVIATDATPTSCTSTSNTVNVTSVTNPTALVLTGSSICSSNPGTGTVSSSTSGPNTISYQLYNSSNTPVQAAKPGTGSGLAWTGLAAGNGYYVIGTGAAPTSCTSQSNSVNVTVVSNPAKPTVTITEPSLCGSATGTLTVTNPVVGATYTVTQSAGGFNPTPVVYASGTLSFTGLLPGHGFNVVATVGACSSATTDCDHLGSVVNRSTTVQFESAAEAPTTVKAYPNPFSDKVKFLVTSPVGGDGNLEIYNMMGQKVKTVYTGFIAAGTQNFELSLPAQQVSTLVYILRIGDKKVTGKILQVNK